VSVVLALIAAVSAGLPSTQEGGTRAPCGTDGRECQCGAWEWQFAFQDYYRTHENTIATGKRLSPSCRSREECAERYRTFLIEQQEAAEFYRKSAEGNRRHAEDFARQGDERWHRIAMGNYEADLAHAKAHDLQASSAVAPHCDLERVRERLAQEFGAPPSSSADPQWVIQPKQSRTQVGVSPGVRPLIPGQFTISPRSAEAIAEMRDNWHRAEALSDIVKLLPVLEAAKNWTVNSAGRVGVDLAGVILDAALYDWDNYDRVVKVLDSRLDPFVRQRNRDICLYEFLYWSQPRRGPTAQQERQFWAMMCRSM
jgi:hypothetical protein